MRFNRMIVLSRLCIAAIAVILFMFIGRVPGMILTGSATQIDDDHDQQKTEPQQVTIILERVYLDGEISEESRLESYWSIENFWEKI